VYAGSCRLFSTQTEYETLDPPPTYEEVVRGKFIVDRMLGSKAENIVYWKFSWRLFFENEQSVPDFG